MSTKCSLEKYLENYRQLTKQEFAKNTWKLERSETSQLCDGSDNVIVL